MPERLRLTRTFGVAGWQAWHTDSDALVLAALAVCLLRPEPRVALRGIWRLMRLWHARLATIEAAALRLALAMPRDVALKGVRIRVEIARTVRGRGAVRGFDFTLRGHRPRGAALPAAPAHCDWTVLRLAAGHEAEFSAMTAALVAAPSGAHLTLDFVAQRRRAPDTLRADFPFQALGQLDAKDGWFPLIHPSRIDIAGTLSAAA